MALSNAQRQQRWREKRDAREKGRPEVVEAALLVAAEGCARLSGAEREALADRLQDVALRHLWRSHELNKVATKVRAGWR